jgi:hypothetical protein
MNGRVRPARARSQSPSRTVANASSASTPAITSNPATNTILIWTMSSMATSI